MIELVDGPFLNDSTMPFDRDRLHIARSFLQAERSLAILEDDKALAAILTTFLDAATDARIRISRLSDDLIIVSSPATRCALRVTGRTARVLVSYLEGKPVTWQQRMDMTMRAARNRAPR